MAKRALIKVVGRQRYGMDSDKIEMTVFGTVEEKDDSFVLCYDEMPEPPQKTVHTALTVTKDKARAELLRSGGVSSLLIIERSKRNMCNYTTDFGDILMGIYGRDIEYDFNGEKGSFRIEYDIDANGALTSRNAVDITVRVNR